jgi:ABC-2 type transport system ATP-binding protein
MRSLAAEGRTVLVSSHLMGEMALTADHLIVIGKGKLLRDEGLDAFVESSAQQWVLVRAPKLDELAALVSKAGGRVRPGTDSSIEVAGMDSAAIGELAGASGMVLHELVPQKASLEEAFMKLTHDSVEYRASRAVA